MVAARRRGPDRQRRAFDLDAGERHGRIAEPQPADTGGYCKARQRLPEALLPRLARDTADRLFLFFGLAFWLRRRVRSAE